ncbi:hypothetical protein PC118_g11118 [Phytophthora cactorum]|uniref:Uncharacterized protein n=1 Tax=Phytophthora cactorum TaxID=29920 RepID=A0A8T1FVS2_9STRA|nr:hypothetical protein PC118_g11118 [Phytophthora cactorum]
MNSLRADLRVIIENSRPLFAKAALEYARKNPMDDNADLATYMNSMASMLVNYGTIAVNHGYSTGSG